MRLRGLDRRVEKVETIHKRYSHRGSAYIRKRAIFKVCVNIYPVTDLSYDIHILFTVKQFIIIYE